MRALPILVALSLLSGMLLTWMFADVEPSALAVDGKPPSLPLLDAPCDGNIIRADPALPDGNFVGSVVLLCTQDLSGTLGFVLNHGTGRHARDAVAGVPRALGTLRRGGPLGAGQGAVLYLSLIHI